MLIGTAATYRVAPVLREPSASEGNRSFLTACRDCPAQKTPREGDADACFRATRRCSPSREAEAPGTPSRPRGAHPDAITTPVDSPSDHSGVVISHWQQGAAAGAPRSFVSEFISAREADWVNEVKVLESVGHRLGADPKALGQLCRQSIRRDVGLLVECLIDFARDEEPWH